LLVALFLLGNAHRAQGKTRAETQSVVLAIIFIFFVFMLFTQRLERYKTAVETALCEALPDIPPHTLYEPMRYTLLSGGKRVRPALAMMACDAVGGRGEEALHAGVAVEILHNFTLVHDDIMDAAEMRRGRPTVHIRWNESAAILSGDGMIAVAYQSLLRSPRLERLRELIDAMNTGILEVCEGQALDLEFQDARAISLDEYFVMIDKKTAKMLELAVKVGGIIGGGGAREIEALRRYAWALGVAFQVQDDLLDISADAAKLGKSIGGDIAEGKKTFLVVTAMQMRDCLAESDRALLDEFAEQKGLPLERAPEMRDLFERNGILAAARAETERLTANAHAALDALPDNEGRACLHEFASELMGRTH
jgi:geranylgeranyl diphosphate synthase type II